MTIQLNVLVEMNCSLDDDGRAVVHNACLSPIQHDISGDIYGSLEAAGDLDTLDLIVESAIERERGNAQDT